MHRQQDLFTLYLAALWFLYIVLSPVYIFHEGLPQPAAIALMFAVFPWAAFAVVNNRSKIPLAYLLGGLFAGLTIIINLVNFAFINDTRFAFSSIYYIYNFLIFLFAVSLFKRDYALIARLTYIGIVIAVIKQGLWAEFLPDPGARRMTAGFKNPNQLAYWSLLSMAMLIFLKRDRKFNAMDIFVFFTGTYIQTLALSKAGIIASGALVLLACFIPPMPRSGRYAALLLGFITCIYILCSPQTLTNIGQKFDALSRVSERLDNVGAESDDSLEGRGYLRITANPLYLLVGAGEGGFERFRTWGSPRELHSGLATIIFSYGVLGFFLFGGFLFCLFYRQPWYGWALLFCVLLFSLSSQTIRFNHTWIFLAIAYATHIYRPRVVKSTDAPPAETNLAIQAS